MSRTRSGTASITMHSCGKGRLIPLLLVISVATKDTIGPISEIIHADSGWLIADCKNIDAFVSAIREVLANPEEAQKRSFVARRLYLDEHSWDGFCEHVRTLPIWNYAARFLE